MIGKHDYVAPRGLPFRKGSMTWRVNMEPIVAIGGGRALILQVLHPLVAAGVEDHSDFENEPFRRGSRTFDVMLKLAFGDVETSRRQAAQLRRLHEQVKGTSSEGVPYQAMDPQLLLWVWATLAEVSLLVYERAVGPLGPQDRARLYEEQKLVAYATGVPEGVCPQTLGDFEDYVGRMISDELQITDVARRVAYAGRHPPIPWPLGLLAGVLITGMSLSLATVGWAQTETKAAATIQPTAHFAEILAGEIRLVVRRVLGDDRLLAAGHVNRE
jgi:uncharacterized protein (DUF2236 family)